jgi:hypothetical protein
MRTAQEQNPDSSVSNPSFANEMSGNYAIFALRKKVLKVISPIFQQI